MQEIKNATFLPLSLDSLDFENGNPCEDPDACCADDIEWKPDTDNPGKVWKSRKDYEDAMNEREQAQIYYNEKLTERQKLKYEWQDAERKYHDNERRIARNVLSNVQLNMVN